jgi:hypothetical protein
MGVVYLCIEIKSKISGGLAFPRYHGTLPIRMSNEYRTGPDGAARGKPRSIMSLHATLAPETLAKLKAQRRVSSISSVVIAFLSILLLALVLGALLLPQLITETMPILTREPKVRVDEPNKPPVLAFMQRNPAAPSARPNRVLIAFTAANITIPTVDAEVRTPSVDYGNGDDFGLGGNGDGPGEPGNSGGSADRFIKTRCSQVERMARLQETGGTAACDVAVVKGLQWLKSSQSQDGSWSGGPAATGLALLAYLGHCETPLSEEFGDSCLRAITNLVNLGMKTNGQLSSQPGSHDAPYEHGIATYALAEATTFCKQLKINVPNLQQVTQQAGQFIIDNQHPSGGWDYAYVETGNRGGDLSITAWQIQALKACEHSRLDFRNLQKCASNASAYVEKLAAPSGAFGYSNSGDGGGRLTGAGMLCLQIWNKGSRSATRNGGRYIDQNVKLDYNSASGDLYCHYYNAQAMLNRGGEQWKRYNAMFREQLLQNQNVDGSFKSPGGGNGKVRDAHFTTCLASLMLEVYYRFLPSSDH